MSVGARLDFRTATLTAFLLVVALICLGPGRALAASPFQEFPVAEAGFSPAQIVPGPDGRLWYTTDQGALEAITTAGVATPYASVGNVGAGSTGIADAPNGTLAFLQAGAGNFPSGSISEVTPAGASAAGPTLTQEAAVSLTAGPDGNLWYITPEYVCKISPSLDPATQNCDPLLDVPVGGTGIATGSDRNLWVTEAGQDTIVKVDPALPQSGALTSYPLPSHGANANSRPFDIAAGPDGALWFTEVLGNRIGRISTSGQITEYDLPNANSDPEGIAQGPDGAMWFTEEAGNRIGRISASGAITEYTIPTANARPTAITTGPDGALWFTENGSSQIGRFDPHPSASLALASGGAVAGRVVALNPVGSVAQNGRISGYAYDFDGSGSFVTTCPVSTPVAYKVFDTPGSHVIGLRVTDSSGLTSTTHVTINVAARAGAQPAIAHPHGISSSITALSQFWCGTVSAVSRGSLGYLPFSFTSEVHAVGIDVTQGVLPDPPRPPGLTLVNKIAAVHLGSFTGGSGFITLNNDEQDPSQNKISWLQQFGTTVVRVYASALVAPNDTDVPNVQMKLYGFRNGHDLPGSPLLSQTGPLDVKVGPPFTTHAMRIGYSAAAGAIPAFTFTLPANWVDQEANMALLAVPQLVGPRLDRQCSTLPCKLAEQGGATFQLANTGLLIVRSVAMESTGQINGTAGAPSFPSPWTAFDAASNIAPVAIFPSPYQGTINIDSITNCKPGDKTAPCTNPNGTATTLIANWLTNNQPTIPATVKVTTIGIHNGYSQINGYSSWPGACSDNANGGALCESSSNSPLSQVDASRPLTSVGHELFHDLGRPHADATTNGCGGNGEGQPDAKGHTQAIGLDRHPGSGGSLTNPYRIVSQDLPTQPTNEYDLMSYCTDNYPETNSWMSAHTWNSVASDWIFFLKRAAAAAVAPLVGSSAAGPAVKITGVTEGLTTAITQIEPSGGGAIAAVAAAPASSPYHAMIRNSSGAVVGNVPLTVTYGHLDGPGHSTPVAVFSGTVPAAGAASAEVTFNGGVVATMHRSAHAPTVKLISPKRGTIGGRRKVIVRWSAHDADGGALTAYVDYSANGGRTWRTVFTGGNVGRVSLSSSYFTGASNARVRVAVNDGFNVTRVVSGRLRAIGTPPAVTILSLKPGEHVNADATTLLSGNAFDDAFTLLTGKRLTWFAGRRRVGTGAMASVTGLAPGRVTIRLQARDRHGRIGSAQVVVRVIGVRPFFTTLSAPSSVSRRARSVRIRVATNIAATLQFGKRRVAVSPRARNVTLSIKRGSTTLRLTLKLSEHRQSASQTLALTRH